MDDAKAPVRNPCCEVADPVRDPRAREARSESGRREDEQREADKRDCLQQRVPLVRDRQEREREDWKPQQCELVPRSGQRDCERYRLARETPATQEPKRDACADRRTAGKHIGRGGRGLRQNEGLSETQTRQRGLPGRRVGREIQDGRAGEQPDLRPRELLHDGPHVAVVGHAGKDEDEGADDDRDAEAAAH
jgi:hypothetical protein